MRRVWWIAVLFAMMLHPAYAISAGEFVQQAMSQAVASASPGSAGQSRSFRTVVRDFIDVESMVGPASVWTILERIGCTTTDTIPEGLLAVFGKSIGPLFRRLQTQGDLE